jgi:hypothetical protein
MRAVHIPTSVDVLAPGAPALEVLASRPKPDGVNFHSIIGDLFRTGEAGTDGVVSVRSARLDGSDSELLLPIDHWRVHHHPGAVLEVRRILLEHLGAVKGTPASP